MYHTPPLNDTRPRTPPTAYNPVFSQNRFEQLRHFFLSFILLLSFWLILSGHYDVFHVSIGILCCLFITYTSCEFFFVHVGARDSHVIITRFLTYIPWHLYQIFKSNIYLAKLVFSPIHKLNPHIISFDSKLTNGLALVTFANSITLTPGTITIEIEDSTFYVHAIDNAVAEDLSSGDMEKRIANIFSPVDHKQERARAILAEESDNLVVKTIARIFTPFIQVYGLYVIAHGHYSPGGGFQGGVILAASIILLALAFGLKQTMNKIDERIINKLRSTGVFIYVGIGLLCLLLGGNFLDYARLDLFLKVGTPQARSLGILGVEIGVGMAVMACMTAIFSEIATGGRLQQAPPSSDNKPESEDHLS